MSKKQKEPQKKSQEVFPKTTNKIRIPNVFQHNSPCPGRCSSAVLSAEEFKKIMNDSYFKDLEKPKRPKAPGRGSSQYY